MEKPSSNGWWARAFRSIQGLLTKLLDTSHGEADLRRVAMQAAGGYLSYCRLINSSTGCTTSSMELRSKLQNYVRPNPGFARRLVTVFSARQGGNSGIAPIAFDLRYRVELAARLQRRVGRVRGGKGALRENILSHDMICALRRRVIRRYSHLLQSKFNVLVFFDGTGEERRSKEAIYAALRTLTLFE